MSGLSDALVIVIPARGLATGKSRLTAALSPEARAALTGRMLTRVIRASLEAEVACDVVVVSPDEATLDLVGHIDPRVHALRQNLAMPGLNPALQQARRWAIRRGAPAMLVLFGDLPLLTADDVRALAWAEAPVVLAPDRHGRGTNAAVVPLFHRDAESAFHFQFGDGSFAAHLAEAERLELAAVSVFAPGTAFDLDTPEDWRSLLDHDVEESGIAMHGLSRPLGPS